ncbi:MULTISPECIES: sensor histidine kinase [Subtercola]|uniref:histidine kinase n=1 Tax=Subtercola vilae TaxID=2056433 RepID=A0A4T2C6S1_9MICO|nr:MULTISPECIES: ATP-binding protein [Subtercola]MEA9984305.1 ATP-binding protein [Subtercola sp. RTI3]TIH40125.1 HAMP domain-containing protein [Subtercola vilae]
MRVVRVPARVTIVVRIALIAGMLASVLLVSGALLVRAALHSAQMTATQQLAGVQASQIIDATRQNVRLFGEFGSLPYELVRTDGALISSSPEFVNAESDRPVVPPPPEDASQIGGEVFTATIASGPLSGQTLTAVSSTLRASSILVEPGGDIPGGSVADVDMTAYRAYVFVTTTAADRAVATIDPYLWAGVVLAVVLLAGTAAITAKRSLRPVDQMRRAADAIAGAPDGARLSVPDSDDELSALAATLNALFSRIDEAALRQKRFTADAAHELRSPITSLITALEIAEAHPGLVSAESTLSHVHGEARRLEGLARDLLELAAASSAEPAQTEGRCDVRAVLRDALSEVEARSPGVGIRMLEPALTGAVLVRLPPRQLRRVLVNLLDNATRHARTVVDSELTVDVDASMARIHIANDGAPIPNDDLARIFEPFVRLDESRSRDTGGAGLGLAIAFEIAAGAGGSLTVASTPSRTVFTVSLPCSEDSDVS